MQQPANTRPWEKKHRPYTYSYANNVPTLCCGRVPVESPNMVAKVARDQGSGDVGGLTSGWDQVCVKSGFLEGGRVGKSVDLCVKFSDRLVSTWYKYFLKCSSLVAIKMHGLTCARGGQGG